MDKESKACMECPVIETCPPQGRTDTIANGIQQRTMSPEEQRTQLSTLRQVIRNNDCPPGERDRLTEPLVRLIHPSRNKHFNAVIIPSQSTPDIGYLKDESARTDEIFSRIKGLKGRRTRR